MRQLDGTFRHGGRQLQHAVLSCAHRLIPNLLFFYKKAQSVLLFTSLSIHRIFVKHFAAVHLQDLLVEHYHT